MTHKHRPRSRPLLPRIQITDGMRAVLRRLMPAEIFARGSVAQWAWYGGWLAGQVAEAERRAAVEARAAELGLSWPAPEGVQP